MTGRLRSPLRTIVPMLAIFVVHRFECRRIEGVNIFVGMCDWNDCSGKVKEIDRIRITLQIMSSSLNQ